MGLVATVKDIQGTAFSVSTISRDKTYPTKFGSIFSHYESAVYKGRVGAFKRPLAFVVYAYGNDEELSESEFHEMISSIITSTKINSTNDLYLVLKGKGYTVFQEEWRQLNYGFKASSYIFLLGKDA